MKSVFCLLFLTFFTFSVNADEPPSFEPFIVYADNNDYYASVTKSESIWDLSIYNTKDGQVFWNCEYYYDGYPSGKLSNDGKYFVYVNDWLEIDRPNQVSIYSSDTSYRFSGKELGLDSASFPHTSSHQIWINEWRLNDSSVVIKTLHHKVLEIQLNDFNSNLENSKLSAEELEQLNSIKQITILVAVFIGFGILMLLISRIRAIKKRKEKL